MNKVIIALFLVSLIYCVSSTSNTNNIIDNIIERNYLSFTKHVDNLKASGELMSNADVDHQNSVLVNGHLPSYNCQHDHIIKSKKIVTPPQPQQTNSSRSRESLAQEVQQTQAVGSIRINFDTTFLYNKVDTRACYQANQQIVFGKGGADCRTSPGTNCVYTCNANDILNNSLANLIENVILPTIREVFSTLLSVNRVDGVLKLTDTYSDRECDDYYRIPDSYFTTGIANTDMLMFITARPTPSTSTIAYALACVFPIYSTNFYGRPVAAGINFNPLYFIPLLNNPNQFLFKEYIRVGIHEATHAFGFSKTFYDSFLDSNTGQKYTYTPSYSFTDSAPTPSGSVSVTRSGIRTPKVVSFVKDHYNCATLQHQLLEDAGGQGTAGSHWEKRTVGEEYMLGYVQPVFPITGLTLSFLEDSGWYDIDFSYAEPLMWGKKLGCNWFAGCTASSWSDTGYFASAQTESCTPTRVGKGTTRLFSYNSNLPAQYQHFSDPRIGGADMAADYCPFSDVTPNTKNAYCVDKGAQANAVTSIFEYYGSDSRCFEYVESSVVKQACWKYQCNANKQLQIQVNDTWITCATPGQISVAQGISVQCPSNFYICDVVSKPIPGLKNETLTIPPETQAPSTTTSTSTGSDSPTPSPSSTTSSTTSPDIDNSGSTLSLSFTLMLAPILSFVWLLFI
ncbi:hypothetical protein CYY_000857 [Polysphondylium violaceum]|uniref:Peptidase M8 n=1 Tax=Polysphondylium violaceum TaxID=133409 RepID=A0A8J4Q2Y8_9MYCE|nr:hypothetical protein CYY_000857 [Polysphondylium violaceum]